MTSFAKLNFAELSKEVKCKTLLFAGQLEIDKWPIMGERALKANKLMQKSTLTIVQNAGHDVTNKGYIQEITNLI